MSPNYEAEAADLGRRKRRTKAVYHTTSADFCFQFGLKGLSRNIIAGYQRDLYVTLGTSRGKCSFNGELVCTTSSIDGKKSLINRSWKVIASNLTDIDLV